MLTRLPEAEVVGVDADPVLLALARSTAPSGLKLVSRNAATTNPSMLIRMHAVSSSVVQSTGRPR